MNIKLGLAIILAILSFSLYAQDTPQIQITEYANGLNSIALSKDDRYLVTAYQNTIVLYDLLLKKTHKKVSPPSFFIDPTQSIYFDPEGKWVLCGSEFYSIPTLEKVRPFGSTQDNSSIQDVVRDQVLNGENIQILEKTDLPHIDLVYSKINSNSTYFAQLLPKNGMVLSFTDKKKTKQIVKQVNNSSIVVWNIKSGKKIATISCNEYSKFKFFGTDQIIVSTNGKISFLEIESQKLISEIVIVKEEESSEFQKPYSIRSFSISNDEKRLAYSYSKDLSAEKKAGLKVIDLETRKTIFEVLAPDKTAAYNVLSSCAKEIILNPSNNFRWDYKNGTLLDVHKGNSGPHTDKYFSIISTDTTGYAKTNSFDYALDVYDIQTNDFVKQFKFNYPLKKAVYPLISNDLKYVVFLSSGFESEVNENNEVVMSVSESGLPISKQNLGIYDSSSDSLFYVDFEKTMSGNPSLVFSPDQKTVYVLRNDSILPSAGVISAIDLASKTVKNSYGYPIFNNGSLMPNKLDLTFYKSTNQHILSPAIITANPPSKETIRYGKNSDEPITKEILYPFLYLLDVNDPDSSILFSTNKHMASVQSKFSHNEHYLIISDVVNDQMVLFDTRNKSIKSTFPETAPSIVWSFDDAHVFYTKLLKNQISMWNVSNNSLVADFHGREDGNYMIITPDHYYKMSKGFGKNTAFRYKGKLYDHQQFDLKFNRPDIVLDRLGYCDSSIIEAYKKAHEKRMKKLGFTEDMLKGDFHIPNISIENVTDLPLTTPSSSVNLNLILKDTKFKLDRINIWINDVAIYGSDGISLREKDTSEYSNNLSVNLIRGVNKVQVSVLNQAGAESYKETVNIECTTGKPKPDLYIITIGESKFKNPNFNLTYAAKDANDIASLFSQSKVYEQVFRKTLINQEVTKENVTALKSFLEKADINDEVMLFVAGHGVLDENLDYFFATYDMDFNNPSQKGLAYEVLEELLDAIKPLKKVLMIDACHSGEIDKEEVELMTQSDLEEGDVQFRAVGNGAKPKLGVQNTSELTKSLFTDLRKGTGATVISSAGGVEFAMESDEWKNGLFTYCLLTGIKNKTADLNSDGEIWLSELQQYVSKKVSLLSHGRQQPTSRIENQMMDFRVW
jgi:hypothetical protein